MKGDLIRESDWKLFRKLQKVALDRFCQRVLSEIASVSSDSSKSAHERYLAIYTLIMERDKSLADAFDNPRRSAAVLQLVQMRVQGLLTEQESAGFSPEFP